MSTGSKAPLTRKSALAHRQPLATPDGGAVMKEVPFEAKVILRCALDAAGNLAAGVLGAPLPAKVHETAVGRSSMVQWLGPDEWLIVAAPGAEAALLAGLTTALQAKPAQVVDVTDYYTTIELSGAHAREMLMKIATVDFHPRVFKPGMGVTTNLGRTVAFARQTREDAYALYVRISMADYLWCLLAEAGGEWGVPKQEPKGGKAKLHLPHFEETPGVTAEPAAQLETT